MAEQGSQGSYERDNGPVRTEDTITPVTVKQVLTSQVGESQEIRIDGQPRKIVHLVGIVKEVVAEAPTLVYKFYDGSGEINVKDYSAIEAVPTGKYYSIWGKPSNKKGVFEVTIFNMKPVTDSNQLAFHYSQALFVHLAALNGLPSNSSYKWSAPTPRAATNQTPQIHGEVKSQSTGSMDDLKRRVLDYVRERCNTLPEGIHKNAIVENFKSSASVDMINQAIEALSFNGDIYQGPGADQYLPC